MSCKIKSPALCGKDCTRTGTNGYCRLCRCNEHCPDFVEEVCAVRVHVPYVCNACPSIDKCTLLKTFYDAEKAHLKSHQVISESRSGLSTSEEEIARLNRIITPLVKQGHSIHEIYITHQDDLMCSEKTIYNYIDDSLLEVRNIDLPRKVRFRARRKKPEFKVDNGKIITASNLDEIPSTNALDLYEFKYISRPAKMALAELKKMFEVLSLNPALLDLPKDRDNGVKQLIQAAQNLCSDAVIGTRKLSDGFELWGESLADSQMKAKMQSACDKVKEEFSNYSAKFNTFAKLNNFRHTMDEIQEIEKQIWTLRRIPEYLDFKSECGDLVSYIASVQNFDIDALKASIENARAAFRTARDSIAEGASGTDAARAVKDALEPVQQQYIDLYYDAHSKKRLGIEDAKRKGKIQESLALKNLRKLHGITILPGAKLSDLETSMANIKVCYELTPNELKKNPICPHCHFDMSSHERNVHGLLDQIDDGIDELTQEWTRKLLETVTDPLVLAQKQYLNDDQQKVIDDFVSTKELPKRVDDFFVESITALLKGFEPVVIDAETLVEKLEQLQPLSEDNFRKKLNDIVASYTKGKDESKLRIVVKRKEN